MNLNNITELKSSVGITTPGFTLNLDEYQRLVTTTTSPNDYPDEYKKLYPLLGLFGEAGEYSEKILTAVCMLINSSQINEQLKKILRDKKGNFDQDTVLLIIKELGDQLWYIAKAAEDLGYSLNEVAIINLNKAINRQENNKVLGNGDDR